MKLKLSQDRKFQLTNGVLILSPDLLTLLARIFSTPNILASSVVLLLFYLNANEEEREVTWRFGVWARTLRIPSEIPSESYPCSLSEDILTNGSKAMEEPDAFCESCRLSDLISFARLRVKNLSNFEQRRADQAGEYWHFFSLSDYRCDRQI